MTIKKELSPEQLVCVGIFLLIATCSCTDYREGPYSSPSRKYSVAAHVNRTDNTKATYASVQLILFDATGHKIDSVDSRAGDFSAWALGWMPQGDTLVLHSSDIGPGAWHISPAGKLQKIALDAIPAACSSKIKLRAKVLRAELENQPKSQP